MLSVLKLEPNSVASGAPPTSFAVVSTTTSYGPAGRRLLVGLKVITVDVEFHANEPPTFAGVVPTLRSLNAAWVAERFMDSEKLTTMFWVTETSVASFGGSTQVTDGASADDTDPEVPSAPPHQAKPQSPGNKPLPGVD